MDPHGRAQWLEATIRQFLAAPGHNNLGGPWQEPAWGDPLVGFSRGDDPLWEQFKEHVGPFCLTPREVFAATFDDLNVAAEQLAVISWVLPQTRATRADNRKEDRYPAERWARSRIFGEQCNVRLQLHLTETLRQAGCRAVAPTRTPLFRQQVSARHGLASTWSERHAAYAAGLGTFGLCDGLITPVGKAVRLGSVVAELDLNPTPRPHADHRKYCLFFAGGGCGACMARCPAGAISAAGKDKEACRSHLFPGTADHVARHYGFDGYGCGLCQTGVPCESGVPSRRKRP